MGHYWDLFSIFRFLWDASYLLLIFPNRRTQGSTALSQLVNNYILFSHYRATGNSCTYHLKLVSLQNPWFLLIRIDVCLKTKENWACSHQEISGCLDPSRFPLQSSVTLLWTLERRNEKRLRSNPWKTHIKTYSCRLRTLHFHPDYVNRDTKCNNGSPIKLVLRQPINVMLKQQIIRSS